MRPDLSPVLARRCLSVIATDDEREDRLGDLEEAFHRDMETRGSGVARRRYVRNAALCILSILRRRLAYAVFFGGEDMFRILLWAIISIFVILACYALAGGQTSELIQPVEWAIILLTMAGCALGANRLRGWGRILQDLRRADRLGGTGRAAARAAAMKQLLAQAGSPGVGPVKSRDFAHLETVVELTNVPEADADRLIGGGIALHRDRSEHHLKIVRATMIDAYVGAAIAFTLGLIHAFGAFQEPLEVMYQLFGAACCPLLFGLLIAHGVVAPMGGRLSELYGEDFREMEALRVSLRGTFVLAAFETLMASERGGRFAAGARDSSRLALLVGLPALMVIFGLIAQTPIADMTARLSGQPADPLKGQDIYYDLPHMTLNLDAPGQPVLNTRLSLQIKGGKAAVSAIESHMPQIMDALQLTLRSKGPDDFRGSAGPSQLRPALQAQINGLIKPQQVTDVLFKNLLIGREQPE